MKIVDFKFIDGEKVPKTPEDYEQDKIREEFAKRWLAAHPPLPTPEERITMLENALNAVILGGVK